MTRSLSRRMALSFLIAAVALLACRPSIAAADEPIVLQLSSDVQGAHPLNLAWQAFADQVGKDTGGAVTIKFFPSAQLYTGPRAVEAVATGALAMAVASPPTVVGLVPSFEVYALPYLAPAAMDEVRLSAPELPLFQYLSTQAAQKGVFLMPCAWWNAGQGGILMRQQTPFKSFAEIKGMKIRSTGGPTYAQIFRELGASTIDLPPTEVPSALQTGAIDGAMGSFAFLMTAASEAAKGIVDTGAFTLGGYVVLANKGIWDKIPARYQQIVVRDLQAANKSYTASLPKTSSDVLAKVKASGHWIYEMTPAEIAALTALGQPLYQQFATRQPGAYEAFVASRKRLGFEK